MPRGVATDRGRPLRAFEQLVLALVQRSDGLLKIDHLTFTKARTFSFDPVDE
jgi:hypothetical protein